MTETYLFDTYALLEIINKNPNYSNYLNQEIVINDFIFSEYCYQLLVGNVPNIEECQNEVEPAIIYPSIETIKKAMKFHYQNKKKKMSLTDCISYIMAKELGTKFLTGDKEFQNLENVEFVK